MEPIVSICIPNYNMGRFVGEAIESALLQTYEFIEVVVVDNASTDDSWSRIRGYAEACDRVRASQNGLNLGMAGNWNVCLSAARGRYVVMLSADDLLMPTFVERCLALHRDYPQLGYVFSEWHTIDEAGNLLEERAPFYENTGIISSEEESRLNLIGGHTIPSSMLIHRERLLGIGGFNQRYHWVIDIDAKVKMNLRYPTGYVRDALCRYRVHAGQSVADGTRSKLLILEIFRLKSELFDSLPEERRGLAAHRPTMIANLAAACVDYAKTAFEADAARLALEYLHLAKSFDLSVASRGTFRSLAERLGTGIELSAAQTVGDFRSFVPSKSARMMEGKPFPLPPGSMVLD